MKFNLKIDAERCKGCELCIAVCPRHVLEMSNAFNASGVHYPQTNPRQKCIGCRLCAVICPDAAIEIESVDAGQLDEHEETENAPASSQTAPQHETS